MKSSALSDYSRVPFGSRIGTTQFPIPFGLTTPPRRNVAASFTGGGIDYSSQRCSSITSVSGTSPISRQDSFFWSDNSSSGRSSPTDTTPTSSAFSSPLSHSRGEGVSVTPSTLMQPHSSLDSVKETPSARTAEFPAPVVPDDRFVVFYAGTILDIKLLENSEEGNVWDVWGGRLILEGLSSPIDHFRVVVKLADWERDSETEGNISKGGGTILKEAEVYEHLAEVAPELTNTPHYYGVFNCWGSIALVLGDSGERLPEAALKILEANKYVSFICLWMCLYRLM